MLTLVAAVFGILLIHVDSRIKEHMDNQLRNLVPDELARSSKTDLDLVVSFRPRMQRKERPTDSRRESQPDQGQAEGLDRLGAVLGRRLV